MALERTGAGTAAMGAEVGDEALFPIRVIPSGFGHGHLASCGSLELRL